jgi:uncharacterized phage protein (TIGR01671 family)
MREFKFRAWSGSHGLMFDADNEDSYISVSAEGLTLNTLEETWCSGSGEWESSEGYVEQDEAVIMQFTGLQDKNGVDIYEGDVIKTYHFTSRVNGKFEYINHIVKWSEKFHGWFLLNCESMDENDGSIQFFVHLRANKDFEITGNIHSNPQLLEK